MKKIVVLLSLCFALNLGATDQFTRITEGEIGTDAVSSYSIAWTDIDSDGYPDIFVCNREGAKNVNFLYHNNGDGTFTRANKEFLATKNIWSTCSSWADYDNDGDMDVYIGNFGNTFNGDVNYFFVNNGDGTFKDITNSSIVIDSSLTMTPVWIDYNNDGDLDLFVTNHCFPPCQDDTQNFLFLNDNGKFLLQDNRTIGLVEDEGNSASWADCDNDGDLDLYTTRNNNTSIYYTNNGDGKFSYQKENRLTDPDGTAGTWADYDNDGDLDIYTNNYGRNNFLYQNDGAGNFTKITNLTVTKDSSFSSGSAWGDYNNDGYLDLFLFCSRQISPAGPRNNHLYKNNGDGSFTRILDGVVASDDEFSHAGELADYDRDGDLDLFVAQIRGEKNALYRNNGNDNNWVNIKLHGTKSNRSAIGAKVRIKAIISGKPVWQLREISSQSAFYAQSSLNAHFGLGDATMIDTIKIEWPSGIIEIKENENSNQFLIYTESK